MFYDAIENRCIRFVNQDADLPFVFRGDVIPLLLGGSLLLRRSFTRWTKKDKMSYLVSQITHFIFYNISSIVLFRRIRPTENNLFTVNPLLPSRSYLTHRSSIYDSGPSRDTQFDILLWYINSKG